MANCETSTRFHSNDTRTYRTNTDWLIELQEAAWSIIADYRRRAKVRRMLNLDARLLDDIGLERADVERALLAPNPA